MVRKLAVAVLLICIHTMSAQTSSPRQKFDAFEVATIKPVENQDKTPRFFKMEGTHRFIAKYYTLKLLVAAAYDLNPRTISGGPDWLDSARFDIVAITPGDTRPTREEQMAMLRNLLLERFKLKFHRELKNFSIYVLTVAKSGSKLKPSTSAPDDPPATISTVYPQKIVLPARNASMADFTAMMQRALLDRPVVDKTGLTGRYDFDLEWAPDETQFGGDIAPASTDAASPPLFTALQQQLGLQLEATHGPVQALIVDAAERPTPN
jgi:uncharacterized protein (TIGR03435 family)